MNDDEIRVIKIWGLITSLMIIHLLSKKIPCL